MKKRLVLALFAALFLVGLFASPAQADGIIIPLPPDCREFPCPLPPHPFPIEQLEIRYHHVDVTIEDQVVTTRVDQVFFNPNGYQIEGTYLFPLPLDAAVSRFVLWIDDQPVEGEVLSAEQARAEYEQIVRSLSDPALLEYAGRGALKASIFPIPPGGERRIELEYSQVLTAENGLVRYIYPLSTEKFSRQPLQDVAVNVKISSSQQPIQAVYSPSHPVAFSRVDDHHVSAGFEAKEVLPDTDFALFYSLGESQAFHLLTYRDPSDPTDADGFFLLLLAPKPGESQPAIPKDVFLVLDRSGSMEGEKFHQAQEALAYVLNHLNEDDRFNVVAFSTGLEKYAASLRPASEAGNAVNWVQRLSAQGNTDINLALLETAAMADRERPTYIIFLTDGLPTTGVTDSQQIIANLSQAAPRNARLFAFGVGYDVDTFLLDSLAQAHSGTSSYVLPGENIQETVSGFYEHISTPVMTDIDLDFGSIQVYDLYPQPLPDLFLGTQIVLVGRYRQGGTSDVTLKGTVGEDPRSDTYRRQVFSSDSRSGSPAVASLPRLWATRKIGYLLNQVRLQGADQETIDQIVKLSIRYGIVTPYTSYLVTEPSALGAEAQDRIANDAYNQAQSAPAEPSFGREAVEKAAGQGAMGGAEAPAAVSAEASQTVRIVGARTFVLADAVWTDTTFDPQADQTVKVPFLSADYFALVDSNPELAAAFALGERVIAFSNGAFYAVVASSENVPPVTVPTLSPTQPQATVVAQVDPTATQAPAATPNAQPVEPGKKTNPLGCLGGLAPLALIAGGIIWLRTRREDLP